MSLETCKKRYEIAKEQGNKEEMKLWKDRAERKAGRHSKYKAVDVNEFLGLKKSGSKKKKSKSKEK